MAVLNRDDYFDRLNAYIGTNTSDESIALLEDLTDTYNDMENRAQGTGEDWEARYHELDESWKQRYQHRFFSGNGACEPNATPEQMEEAEAAETAAKISIDDLFE